MTAHTLFISDQANSALDRVALNLASRFDGTVLRATDFWTPYSLLRRLSLGDAERLHFVWRGALAESLGSRAGREALLRLRETKQIGYSVANCLGMLPHNHEPERVLAEHADYVTVTSRQLLDFYRDSLGVEAQLLHDLPSPELMNRQPDGRLTRARTIVWIGNSRWGARRGMLDHKGLRTVAMPAAELLKRRGSALELLVIDSAQRSLPNAEVVETLSRASMLWLTSASEGTALPILEALAVGTQVVSTDVGIAREALSSPSVGRIVARTPEAFVDAALSLRVEGGDSSACRAAFDAYVASALNDQLPELSQRRSSGHTNSASVSNLDGLKWPLRKARAARRRLAE